ncbi:MAG: M20 family metallopeptidase [Kineosporiaceae bacterium]
MTEARSAPADSPSPAARGPVAAGALAGLRADAEALAPSLTDLRHRLHRAPEVGLQLPGTQALLREELAGLDLELSEGSSLTSLTGVLRGGATPSEGPRPVVLLRADMDALPVTEEATNGVPLSEHEGRMHACGHDLHMSGLVGGLRLLHGRRDRLSVDVVAMFQPGEEGWDGAAHMVAEGVLDAAGRRADAAFALHVFSGQALGSVATRPGPLMAASDGVYITVRGRGGHGSAPHTSLDPVPAACEIVLALQTALTRSVDPLAAAVITVGVIRAGTKRNVIPDEVELEATVRTFDPAVRSVVEALITRVATGIAAAHGVTADVRYQAEYPVTVNDGREASYALEVAAALYGERAAVRMPQPITGSEDFSRVLAEVPGAMAFVGACPPGSDPATAPSNHSPRATFDDAALPMCAALYAGFALAWQP